MAGLYHSSFFCLRINSIIMISELKSSLNCFLLLMICLQFISCQQSLTKEEYVKWVEDVDNGLHVLKKTEGLIFDLQFQPADYQFIVSPISKNQPLPQPGKSEMQFYQLRIKSDDPAIDWMRFGQTREELQKRLYYYSYLFQDDITIIENDVTSKCIMFHFEQSQGGRQSSTFLIGFENPFPQSEDALLVIDSEHISSLPVKIKVSKANIPKLKI